MTRPLRTNSTTGIYHVMLRGINRQIIFEHEGDYVRFKRLLMQMTSTTDEQGNPMPPLCTLYAYCLMPNHVHLLIQEKNETISNVIKRIAAAYALYYNKKYEHFGHLFQDRFKSEPVENEAYFITLLRYIHQNPVAGGLCKHMDEYAWSSWNEYIGHAFGVCSINPVFKRIAREELIEMVNEPLPKTVSILDFDKRKGSVTDDEISEYLTDTYGLRHPCDLQLYSRERRNDILHAAKQNGATIRQLSRLTGLSERIVRDA